MKVLMLGWELPPHNSGGLGVACLQLAKALASSGADIDFVLPYSSEQRYDFMRLIHANSAKVATSDSELVLYENPYASYRYNQKNEVHWSNQQTVFEEAVARHAEEQEFDIIHAHDWLTFRAGLLAHERSGKPLIVHVHSTERDRSGGNYGNPIVREIEATTMLIADRVIAVSERIKQIVIDDYNIPADKVEVIHNSIDSSYLDDLDSENSYRYLADLKEQGWKIVVNIGRLTIQKGLSHFLRAAANVARFEPKTMFMLVGSGEQRDELIELAAELGIADKVVFPGFQRGKSWRDAYAIADLFVMPSVSEPFGLTPLEATAYGTPVLISKQSGIAEVLHSCLKVDFWDEDEMANKMAAVVASRSLSDELHANAWNEYQKMSWDNAANRLMDMYDSYRQKAAMAYE